MFSLIEVKAQLRKILFELYLILRLTDIENRPVASNKEWIFIWVPAKWVPKSSIHSKSWGDVKLMDEHIKWLEANQIEYHSLLGPLKVIENRYYVQLGFRSETDAMAFKLKWL